VSGWTPAQLAELASADEVRIAPRRTDGTLLRERIIWVVSAPDADHPASTGAAASSSAAGRVFVRSTNGPTASWFRTATRSRRADLRTRSGTVAVTLTPVSGADLDVADQAYRAKYGRRYRSIVEHLLGGGPRPATLELHPEPQQ
jgi:hypothetical protein